MCACTDGHSALPTTCACTFDLVSCLHTRTQDNMGSNSKCDCDQNDCESTIHVHLNSQNANIAIAPSDTQRSNKSFAGAVTTCNHTSVFAIITYG